MDDTAILHSHFCTLHTHFLSLTHNGDSWIYTTISSLALCCAEQSILPHAGPLYRVLRQLQMRDRQAIEWGTDWVDQGIQILHTHTEVGEGCHKSWAMRLSHILLDVTIIIMTVLTWSNCASSPLWRDRDRGFSC